MFKYKYVSAALGVMMLLGAALPAQASALTSGQIQAIIGLLQSFGADQSVIENVNEALMGSSVSSGISCTSFTNAHYGSFDTNPGGPVSQLQDFLGIPSNTFGYGTYGPKTLAMWNARCGQNQTTSNTTSTSANFTATPTSGGVPLTVSFSSLNLWQPVVDSVAAVNFGDGTSGTLGLSSQTSCTGAGAAIAGACTYTTTHTYTSPGTYNAILKDSSGNVLGTQTITVGGSTNTNQASVTIDPTSLTTNSQTPTIYGYAKGVTGLGISINNSNGQSVYANAAIFNVNSGTWSFPIAAILLPGTYTVVITEALPNNTSVGITGGTLTVTNSGSNSAKPSATIDQNSLALTQSFSGSLQPLSGTVANANSIAVTMTQLTGLQPGTVAGIGTSYPTISGHQWSMNIGTNLTVGTYSIQVIDKDSGSNYGSVLASGTLTVTTSGSNLPPQSVGIPQPVLSMPGVVTLNGSGQYYALGAIPDSQNFTVSAWVLYTGSGCSTIFSDADSAPGNDVILGMDANTIYMRADKNGAQLSGFAAGAISGCGPIALLSAPYTKNYSGAWHHIVWTNTGPRSFVYIDGSQLIEAGYSGSNVGYHAGSAQIGRMFDGANGSYPQGTTYFNGSIADVRYWTSALSADQVTSLYSAGMQYHAVNITPSNAH